MRKAIGRLVLAGALGALGCGGDDDDGPGAGFAPPATGAEAVCVEPSGAYVVRYTETSGTCGPVPDLVVVISDADDPSCAGTETVDAACVITGDVTCTNADGSRVRGVGQERWKANGSAATGTYQLFLYDAGGALVCQSIYAIEVGR